jgi:hypothetical protein
VESARDLVQANTELARRLRALRETHWPELALTQAQIGQVLAEGLGGDRKALSVAAISSWESPRTPRMPQPSHLRAYALFFATRRSVEAGRLRLLDDTELTAAEHAQRHELEEELLGLREAALQAATSRLESSAATPDTFRGPNPLGEFWRFGEREDVTIVGSELPSSLKDQIPLADRSSPDYVAMYAYADLDALLELHGQIRAVNPLNQVNIRQPAELREDDYTTHLVLLGGVDWNQATEDVLALLDLPVSLESATDRAEAYFEVREGAEPVQYEATVASSGDRLILREDVGHFYRGANPYNVERTVTICQALFGRGTYGVVRALTDARFRVRNEEYIKSRFAGRGAFSILTRVPIQRGLTVTPDWTRSDVRLHEWAAVAE